MCLTRMAPRRPEDPEGTALPDRAEPPRAYAFCEPVTDASAGLVHIRARDDEVKVFGGVEGDALCGRDMTLGWDRPTPVTLRTVEDALDGLACTACAGIWAAFEGQVL